MKKANLEVDTKIIHGIFIGRFRDHRKTGADRSAFLFEPYLREHGIVISHISNLSTTMLWVSIAKYLKHNSFRRIDFIVFNALGSFILTPYSYWLITIASWFKVPVFVYWHELKMTFDYFDSRYPKAKASMDKVVRGGKIIHLAASSVVQEYIQSRYPNVKPINISNCAEVPDYFAAPILPSVDPPFIVMVGTIEFRKGIDLFIRTAIKVCQVHPTVEFVWLGESRINVEMKSEISASGFEDRIFFPGFIEVPSLIMRRAAVIFISSREEAFSMVTAEAMCMARTIVCFESGGPLEVLGGTGIVIKDFNTDEAADTILQLLERDKIDLINLPARERYLNNFTPQKHAVRMAQIINENLRNLS